MGWEDDPANGSMQQWAEGYVIEWPSGRGLGNVLGIMLIAVAALLMMFQLARHADR